MPIDETLNAVEVENSGHTDKSISHYPSNSNSFTEGLGAGRAKTRSKLNCGITI